MFEITKIELDTNKFKDVFRNQSMFPEERAERACKDYVQGFENLQTNLIEELQSKNKELSEVQKNALETLFKEKSVIYKRLVEDVLYSESRCASTMITGRGNFNYSKNEKAFTSSMNKYNKLSESKETWLNMAYKKLESLKSDTQHKDEFLKSIINQFAGNLAPYCRALLKGQLERRAKKQDISETLDYLEDNIKHFKITLKSIQKLREIKLNTQNSNINILEIDKSEYFANRALVRSLGFRWNKFAKQWEGTLENIKKYQELKSV